MERALTLVASGTLTISLAHGNKGAVTLPRTFNPYSGKESMRQTGFSDAAWGKATRGYATSICALTNARFHAIVTEAQKYAKPTRGHNRASDATEIIDVDEGDERACLVENSDSDQDCNVLKKKKSLSISLTRSFRIYTSTVCRHLRLVLFVVISSCSICCLSLLSFCFLALHHHFQIQLWLRLAQALCSICCAWDT